MEKEKLYEILNNNFFDTNDISFAKRVFSTDQKKYLKRLQLAGFENKKIVCDIGAGFGQWTLVLSKICEKVYAVESDQNRIRFLRELVKIYNLENVEIVKDNLPTLKNLPSKEIDGILCFSTIMLTPWKSSINTFLKLLKYNGTAYFNINSWGYYLKIWNQQKNKNLSYSPRETVLEAIRNNILYSKGKEKFDGHILIENDELFSFLKKKKIKLFKIGTEEELFKKQNNNFFESKYKGLDTIYEVIIKK